MTTLLKSAYTKIKQLLMTISFANKVYAKVYDKEVDIIFCRDFLSSLAGLKLKKKYPKAKLVMDICEYPEYSGRTSAYIRGMPKLIKLLFTCWHERFLKASTLNFSICESCTTKVHNAHRYNIELYRNYKKPILKTIGKKKTQELGFLEGDFVIVCPGQPDPVTGTLESIETLKYLPDSFKLLIIGNNSNKEFIKLVENKILQLNLTERIKIKDTLPNHKYHEVLNGCDIALIPMDISIPQSKYITPNRFLDCVASKIPVLATANIEIAETIKEYGNGKILEHNDPKYIAKSILSMMDEKQNLKPEYKKKLNEVAVAFDKLRTFDNKNFAQKISNLISEKKEKTAVILARADISKNLRAHNIIKIFLDEGFKTKVFSIRNEVKKSDIGDYQKLEIENIKV